MADKGKELWRRCTGEAQRTHPILGCCCGHCSSLLSTLTSWPPPGFSFLSYLQLCIHLAGKKPTWLWKGSDQGHIHTLLRASSERGQEGKEMSTFWAPSHARQGAELIYWRGVGPPICFWLSFWLYLYFLKLFSFALSCTFLNLSLPPCHIRGSPNWQLHQLQRKPTLPTLGKGLSREYNGSGASGILQGS